MPALVVKRGQQMSDVHLRLTAGMLKPLEGDLASNPLDPDRQSALSAGRVNGGEEFGKRLLGGFGRFPLVPEQPPRDAQDLIAALPQEGKRLNSPNDLVYRSDGALYFTDPPFGLPKFFEDPRKELPFSGVYCLINGKLLLVSKDLQGPNGLAFSPDEKYFYVTNWDEKKKVVMRYEVNADGTLSNSQVFFDMTSAPGEDALDGMKVDQKGNLYVSGPGGLWILSPEGKHLGTIIGPEHPHNMAWGDDDGRTLYLCARSGLYRIRLNIPGIRP